MHHLLLWAPRLAWVALAIGIATLHAYSVYTQAWRLRQAGLMASFLWWLLLTALALADGEAWRPFTALALANGITAFVFYVRLGATPHHGSMAEGSTATEHRRGMVGYQEDRGGGKVARYGGL